MKFKYYYGAQADQFSFIRIPKIMLIDSSFQQLSLSAKVLYGVLLDRMSLSMRNHWLDEEQRVYIIYQIGEIQERIYYSLEALEKMQRLRISLSLKYGEKPPITGNRLSYPDIQDDDAFCLL